MKKTWTVFTLLITLCCFTIPAKAQKAYEILTYKATINGNQATLQIADGYLLASKVIIHSKYGDKVFLPTVDDLDAAGDLRFDAIKGVKKNKDKNGLSVTLKKLNESHFPAQIKAVYWNGKIQKAIVFKVGN